MRKNNSKQMPAKQLKFSMEARGRQQRERDGSGGGGDGSGV